ncbi:hypothetical protein ABZX92_45780, partial [Lentzea sp. NPDC006480]|uniref:hypothetical protein n=1 Tax=Lentzea sp. NPDC006480 TaxID=3157176 RepID=UPI0033B893DC
MHFHDRELHRSFYSPEPASRSGLSSIGGCKRSSFGNGRVARKLFEAMVNNQASRLATAPPSKDS